MNRKWGRVATLGALIAAFGPLAVTAAPVATQTGEEMLDRSSPDEDVIRQIERDSEAVITGRNFTYDPDGRRDPFEPLVKTEIRGIKGKRPKGVAGMMVSEIALKGVTLDLEGRPIALFSGSDNRGYTLRIGDIVYDGRVVAIDYDRGAVVFRQQVDDPRRIKPYRDVVKRLYPIEDADDESLIGEEGA